MAKTLINEVVLARRINGLSKDRITGGEGVVSSNLACPTNKINHLVMKSEVAFRTSVHSVSLLPAPGGGV